MAELIVCEKCKNEYVVSENFPDPCSSCGLLHSKFKSDSYVEQIGVVNGLRERQVVKKSYLVFKESSTKISPKLVNTHQ